MKYFLALTIFALFSMMPDISEAKKKNIVISKFPVDQSFSVTSMSWNNSPKKGFIVHYKTTRINGEIAICGSVTFPNVTMASHSVLVLKKVFIEYQGKKIMRDMRFFTRVKRSQDITKSVASCASTGIKTPKGKYTVYLRFYAGQAS